MDNSHYRHFIKKLLIVVFAIILLLFIKEGIRVVLLVFAGILMAIFWRGLAHWLSQKLPIKEMLALVFVIVFNFLLFGLLYIVLAPGVSNQITELSQRIPEAVNELISDIRQSEFGRNLIDSISDDLNVSEAPMERIGQVFNIFAAILQFIIDIVVIAVFGVFFAVNPHLYRNGFLSLFPHHRRKRVKEIFKELDTTLFRWFLGQIIDMFITAVLTGIGLWLLDVPLVLAFAVITFFLSFIPNIGPVVSAIPPVLISLMDSPEKALSVALMYLGVQLFESYVITPNVQKRAIRMPPVLLLVIQIFFTIILGLLALFLSTPLLATVIVVIRMAYVEDVLGDKEAGYRKKKKPKTVRAKSDELKEKEPGENRYMQGSGSPDNE
jgi:predicted PurR-regulated permease PerM